MSRYSGTSNGSNGGDYDDQRTIKLQQYAALRVTPDRVVENTHQQYGQSFITNFSEATVLEGIVFQRDDKPDTWKVFSPSDFFAADPETGLVYEREEDGEFVNQMSAQDILDHSRVSGFQESFGGNRYFYTPVGVVIEADEDIAVNDTLDVETTDDPGIVVGESSMLLSNKAWTRTLAKKLTASGHDVINDNGQPPTPRGEPDENPKYDSHNWLATDEPELRDEIEGREIELWVTEEVIEDDDGTTTEYSTPNVMDVKTGNTVTIDNGVSGSDDSENTGGDQQAAADGGTTTQPTQDTTTTETPETTETTDSPDADGSDDGLPEGVPEKLENLLAYLDRNNDTVSANDVKMFAEDEVDDPDAVDWGAAATAVNEGTY